VLGVEVVVPPGTFYPGVYLKDVSGVNMAVCYSLLLVTGDENGVHECYEFVVGGFMGCGYMGWVYSNGKEV
jgi:hypothetical protein